MTPIEKLLLFVAAPATLLLALAEAVVLSRRHAYDWRALGVSLFDYLLNTRCAHRVHHATNLEYLDLPADTL